MKIIEIKELKTKKLPGLYCSPLVPPEDEEQAIAWASRRGAKVLYKFKQGDVYFYFVEVKE